MRVFLATPISSFNSAEEFHSYRKKVLNVISALRIEHHVQCEIEEVKNDNNYDSPADSFTQDLSAIHACDAFILHYPQPLLTSALIELGIALALEKIVIIITPDKHLLPYLVQAIDTVGASNKIIEDEHLGETATKKIIGFLRSRQ